MKKLLFTLLLLISVNVWAKSETKYYCDRCGHAQNNSLTVVEYEGLIKENSLEYIYQDRIKKELCQDCHEKYIKLMQDFLSNRKTEYETTTSTGVIISIFGSPRATLEIRLGEMGKYKEGEMYIEGLKNIVLPPLPFELLTLEEICKIVCDCYEIVDESCLGTGWKYELRCIKEKAKDKGINIELTEEKIKELGTKSKVISWCYHHQTKADK